MATWRSTTWPRVHCHEFGRGFTPSPSVHGLFQGASEEAQELIQRLMHRGHALSSPLKLAQDLYEHLLLFCAHGLKVGGLHQTIQVNLLRTFHKLFQHCSVLDVAPELLARDNGSEAGRNLVDRVHKSGFPNMSAAMLGVLLCSLEGDHLAGGCIFWCRYVPFCEENIPKLLVPIERFVATIHDVPAVHLDLITTQPPVCLEFLRAPPPQDHRQPLAFRNSVLFRVIRRHALGSFDVSMENAFINQRVETPR
mmetsp:Transcript_24995/g.56457  ORF Transcript_24995/g.56457 Transcript_24995/m.56457 type:complete len:252 (-) Transcript_24995:81-836(-)